MRLRIHRRHTVFIFAALVCCSTFLSMVGQAQRTPVFTLEQVMSYPFPARLVASPAGDRIAWTFVKQGVRSLWVADGPDYKARALVTYAPEDGQELSGVTFSGDGKYVVYVRGGDHGSNWTGDGDLLPNPTSSPIQPKQQVWAIAVGGASGSGEAGSQPILLGEGDAPAPSPNGDRVAFEQANGIAVAPIDGSKQAVRLFFARGRNQSPVWSPDGRTLAFVSSRGSLSYIGLYSGDDQPLRYLSPAVAMDETPRWSPDGTRIAFVRRPARGGPAAPPLETRPQPWALWVADVKTGDAREVWRSPDTARGSYPRTEGGPNLAWGAEDRLVFLSYHDGWPHVYSVPAAGGRALLLTPGSFMVEYVTLTPDRRFVIYNANAGADKDDIERRHLFRVPVGASTPAAITRGTGLEWSPVVTANGRTLAYLAATAQKPPLPYVRPLDAPVGASAFRALAEDQLPEDFPTAQLVTPEHLTYTAPDGTPVHAQLFKPAAPMPSSVNGARPAGTSASPAPPNRSGRNRARATPAAPNPNEQGAETRRPAIVFVHGGPPRQMLLGWHYRFYYANAYAVNQYLASRGFVVLSVNYRLGIGYGYDFHYPREGGVRGASEYQDVVAGAKYLQSRPDVDPKRIGIWGGSYGGYLVALALARNSDLFTAGVDIHGVHNRASLPSEPLQTAASVGDGVTPADLEQAARVAWASSPVSSIATWKAPVLLIHGDDDRNVRVDQTVDLAVRLKAAGVPFEEIIIPDDIHDFLLYRNWLRVNRATTEFLERKLRPAFPGTGSR
jgi:dipeptidyl aminopeptidase/acylaminoacyl peptidase